MAGYTAGRSTGPARACRLLVLVVMVVLVAGYASGPNPHVGTMGGGRAGGFLVRALAWGTAPVTFVISMFNAEVGVYEVHNAGAWFDFGFVLGLGCIFGGGSSGARSARR